MSMAQEAGDSTVPLVAHVIYRLDFGGLENGLVNLVNHLPRSRYRHLIVCLADFTDFAHRIERDDVELIALHKRPGHDLRLYRDLFRLFRRYRPAIVHSRNLAALESQLPAWLAGVPVRIHGEHGRDMSDPDGTRRRYILQRRMLRPFVSHYIALSRELEDYLAGRIGVNPVAVTRILNGVDIERFRPDVKNRNLLPQEFQAGGHVVFGTVGRLDPVKDQLTLIRAFAQLMNKLPEARQTCRLALIGDGGERERLENEADQLGIADHVWFAGMRSDVSALLQALDVFVLPSRAEGISNTIMEAMASGLPVVATAVGGNPELVVDRGTGRLVPPGDPVAMADAMREYASASDLRHAHGQGARRRAEEAFSLEAMVAAYDGVYQKLLGRFESGEWQGEGS